MSKSTQRWAINSTHWQPGESEFQFLLSLLPAQEANACVTYVKKADQKRALLSRLLQRAACCSALDVSFVDVVIKRTKGNKPFFCGDADKQDAPNYNFNVSHEVPGYHGVDLRVQEAYRLRMVLVWNGMMYALLDFLGWTKEEAS